MMRGPESLSDVLMPMFGSKTATAFCLGIFVDGGCFVGMVGFEQILPKAPEPLTLASHLGEFVADVAAKWTLAEIGFRVWSCHKQ